MTINMVQFVTELWGSVSH